MAKSRWRPNDGPRGLDDSLTRIAHNLGDLDANGFSTIIANWAEIAGPALAEHSEPIKFADGTLLLRVDNPAWGTQITLLNTRILERLGTVVTPAPTRLTVVIRAR